MKASECQIKDRVQFRDGTETITGIVGAVNRAVNTAEVHVEGDEANTKIVPISKLRHYPLHHVVRIRFPQSELVRLEVGKDGVEIIIDTSASYDRGMMKVLQIQALEGGGMTDSVVVGRTLWMNTEAIFFLPEK